MGRPGMSWRELKSLCSQAQLPHPPSESEKLDQPTNHRSPYSLHSTSNKAHSTRFHTETPICQCLIYTISPSIQIHRKTYARRSSRIHVILQNTCLLSFFTSAKPIPTFVKTLLSCRRVLPCCYLVAQQERPTKYTLIPRAKSGGPCTWL